MTSESAIHDRRDVWHVQVQDSELPDTSCDIYSDEDFIEELHGYRSWVGPAVASAIFCFPPTGLIAVYNAVKAHTSFEAGDLHSWKRYTGRARFLVFLTIMFGIVVYIAIVVAIQSVKNIHTT